MAIFLSWRKRLLAAIAAGGPSAVTVNNALITVSGEPVTNT